MVGGGCVSITPTHYIYTHGEESGYIVELINYPRFPKEIVDIERKAIHLAKTLLEKTYQGSFTIQFPYETYYYSVRGY